MSLNTKLKIRIRKLKANHQMANLSSYGTFTVTMCRTKYSLAGMLDLPDFQILNISA
jgi:hypothetical protein